MRPKDEGFPWQPSAAWAGTQQRLREETLGGKGGVGGGPSFLLSSGFISTAGWVDGHPWGPPWGSSSFQLPHTCLTPSPHCLQQGQVLSCWHREGVLSASREHLWGSPAPAVPWTACCLCPLP